MNAETLEATKTRNVPEAVQNSLKWAEHFGDEFCSCAQANINYSGATFHLSIAEIILISGRPRRHAVLKFLFSNRKVGTVRRSVATGERGRNGLAKALCQVGMTRSHAMGQINLSSGRREARNSDRTDFLLVFHPSPQTFLFYTS